MQPAVGPLAALSFLLVATHAMFAPAQQLDLARLRQRMQSPVPTPEKKVLAFYYPWYGTPSVTGRWVHWQGVDPHRRTIANSTHYPAIGPYDSHDRATIDRHARWCASAGIDGLIASWWRPNDFHDRAFPLLLQAARRHGLQITAYFETVPSGNREQALQDVLYLLQQYGRHPAWLKVAGRPVLFVYARALRQIGLDGWLWVITETQRRFPGGAVFIGDELSVAAAHVFDGIHTYNITEQTAGKSPEQIRQWARSAYRSTLELVPSGRIACLTVIPGYDDTKLGRPAPRPVTERHRGATYRVLWEEALAANPDWIIITSFNEWHEGSEIEPSVEHGDRELKATRPLAERFKRQRPRSGRHGAELIDAAARQRLAERLRAVPIGVLPDARSPALFVLAALGADLRPVRWEQLARRSIVPAEMPFLLYAGGEVYVAGTGSENAVTRTNEPPPKGDRAATEPDRFDVLHGIRHYVAKGGTLVVMPAAPSPFHYDRTMDRAHAVHHAPALGLPIRGGWETPPHEPLHFVKVDRALPHVPDAIPFPQTGDRRWRPLVPGDRPFRSLLKLTGPSGRDYGLGAVIGRVGDGRVAYVWFRLLEGPAGRALIHDLWSLLLEEASVR